MLLATELRQLFLALLKSVYFQTFVLSSPLPPPFFFVFPSPLSECTSLLIGWQDGSSSASTFSFFCCTNMERPWKIMPGDVHIRYQGKFLHGKGGQVLKWAAQGGSGVFIL